MENYRAGFYVEVNVAGVDAADARNRATGLIALALDESPQLTVRRIEPLIAFKENHDDRREDARTAG